MKELLDCYILVKNCRQYRSDLTHKKLDKIHKLLKLCLASNNKRLVDDESASRHNENILPSISSSPTLRFKLKVKLMLEIFKG